MFSVLAHHQRLRSRKGFTLNWHIAQSGRNVTILWRNSSLLDSASNELNSIQMILLAITFALESKEPLPICQRWHYARKWPLQKLRIRARISARILLGKRDRYRPRFEMAQWWPIKSRPDSDWPQTDTPKAWHLPISFFLTHSQTLHQSLHPLFPAIRISAESQFSETNFQAFENKASLLPPGQAWHNPNREEWWIPAFGIRNCMSTNSHINICPRCHLKFGNGPLRQRILQMKHPLCALTRGESIRQLVVERARIALHRITYCRIVHIMSIDGQISIDRPNASISRSELPICHPNASGRNMPEGDRKLE